MTIKKLSTSKTKAAKTKPSKQLRVKPATPSEGQSTTPRLEHKEPEQIRYLASDEQQRWFAESFGSELIISFPWIGERSQKRR